MTTTTRIVNKQDILNRLIPRLSAKLRGFVMPLTFTANGTAATTIRDTRLNRASTGAADYDRCAVEITSKAGAGPAIGEVAGVTNAGYDQVDKLTLAPTFSATPQSGDTYNLYPPEISPEQLNQAINDLLRNTEAPYVWFPSMVDDSEFLILSKWADIGTSTTALLSTNVPDNVLGESSLKIVLSNGPDTGRQSLPFDVKPGDSLIVDIFARTDVGEYKIQLYDVTNSAVIEEATVDSLSTTFHQIRFVGEIPNTCAQCRIRFISVDTIVDMRLAGPLVVQSRNGARYRTTPLGSLVPSPWLMHSGQISRAVSIPQGMAGLQDFTFAALDRGMKSAKMPDFIRSDRGVIGATISFAAGSDPTALLCYRAFDELSSDTATSTCDRDYVMWRACANILEEEGDKRWRDYARRAAALRRTLGYGLRRRRSRDNTKVPD